MKRLAPLVLVPMLIVLGCSTDQFRLQSDDEDKDKAKDQPAEVKSIGTVTTLWGAEPIRVMGVGVIHGLQGTGGEPMPSEYRRQVMHDLQSRGVEDPAAFLSTRDTAIVLVSAVLPPGMREGDRVDVGVELIPEDKATSLRGGHLLECDLYEYTQAGLLKQGARGTLRGKRVAVAEGAIITGMGDEEDKERHRHGRVWNGARSLIDRNFMLLVNKENQDSRTARIVAERINERFYGPFRGSVRGMAEAKTTGSVTLKIPSHYKNNWPRFIRVVRNIPLRESGVAKAQYQRQLAEQLLDPALTVTAALKLEALNAGQDEGIAEDLKRGLRSSEPLVRFCSAEALAYLGNPVCGEPLAEIVLKEPQLRAYGLTALASLDEAICVVELRKLLSAPSAETKYGAFRALATLSPKDAMVQGEVLNESFSLHRVAPHSSPLVHVSTQRRAEVVLFGEEPVFLPPFGHQAGPDFLVTAAQGDGHCIISRISAQHGVRKESCPLRVEDVVRKLGHMGATYPDVVELLIRSAKYKNLSCGLAIDALPQAPSVYQMVYDGLRTKVEQEAEDSKEIELGATPNLFALPGRRAKNND
jgi:flagellar basal body P-ring protein FlgI